MASEIDKVWFEKHLDALEEEYKGHFIAILNEKVIAHSENYEDLSDLVLNLKNSGKISGIPIIARASKKNPAAIKIPSI